MRFLPFVTHAMSMRYDSFPIIEETLVNIGNSSDFGRLPDCILAIAVVAMFFMTVFFSLASKSRMRRS